MHHRLCITRAVAIAIGLSTGPLTFLEGQTSRTWEHYCSAPAETRMCMSIFLTLTPRGTGTTVDIQARNFEGTDGTVPWALRFGVYDLLTGPVVPPSIGLMYALSNAQLSGSADLLVTDYPLCLATTVGCNSGNS